MARDYDAELARAMEKVARIKKAKQDALRRKREPIGKVMLELYPDMEECNTEKEIKEYINSHFVFAKESTYEEENRDEFGGQMEFAE